MRTLRPQLLFATALACALAPTRAVGQAPPKPPADSAPRAIAPVVVRERQAARTVGGAAVVEVSTDSMRTPPAANLDQALRAVPFVSVRTNSRGESELSVRASDSRQPAILLDGVPMSLGWDARTDPSIIPLTGASGIRVSRTLSSLMHGPNVVGGTVEVGLTDGLDQRRGVLATGTDQTGAYSASASFGGPIALTRGTIAAVAGVGRRDRSHLVAPAGLNDGGADGRRVNTDFEQTDLFGAARFTASNGAFVGLTVSTSDGERGVAPETHIASPRLWRIPEVARQVAILSLASGRIRTPWGVGSADLRASRNQGQILINNYGTDRSYTTIAGSERGDERTNIARLILEHSLGPRGDLGVSASTATIDYDETLDAAPAVGYRQRLSSLAIETDWQLPRLAGLAFAVALDRAENPRTGGRAPLAPRSAWAARLGATKTFLDAGMRVHGSVTRRARFPALRELYSGALNRFEPNPALKPERVVSAEIGTTMTRGRLDLQSALFYNALDDAVVRITLPNRKYQRVNKNRARTPGVEFLATLRLDGVTVLADLTLQDPQLIDIATDGRTRPEYQPQLRGSVTTIVPLAASTRATAAFQHVGAQYCENPDLGGQQRLGDSGRLDALVDHTFSVRGFWSQLRVTLGLDNVFNRTVYDQCGLPQAGRTLRIGMEVR
ncbi:MAG TPA: TonB-dependent receptor [Gemmatimonadaceae bacterium]|nr:TonB-dependent receptor [Gemmatimonadaceae bacterium]